MSDVFFHSCCSSPPSNNSTTSLSLTVFIAIIIVRDTTHYTSNMKSIISLVVTALSVSSAVAFVPSSTTSMRASSLSMAKLDMTPELESAIADVRAAASEFGEETAHFANGKFLESFTLCSYYFNLYTP